MVLWKLEMNKRDTQTHRLTFSSPSVSTRLSSVEMHDLCDLWLEVRSGQQKGGALLARLSSLLKASPQNGHLPTTKNWNISKRGNLGKPPYLFSLLLPRSDIPACGARLYAASVVVSSLCHYPATHIILPAAHIAALLIAGWTDSKWAMRLWPAAQMTNETIYRWELLEWLLNLLLTKCLSQY